MLRRNHAAYRGTKQNSRRIPRVPYDAIAWHSPQSYLAQSERNRRRPSEAESIQMAGTIHANSLIKFTKISNLRPPRKSRISSGIKVRKVFAEWRLNSFRS